MVTVPAPTGQHPKPLIVVTEPIAPTGLDILRQAGELVIAHETDPTRMTDLLARADALVVRSSPVNEELLRHTTRLRVLGRHGAGLDTVDLDAASRRGIAVVNTPGANAASVAEFVVLTTLALSRHLVPASAALARGDLLGRGSLPGAVVGAGMQGRMLAGRTVGLIGLGAIGRRVADLVTAFGAVVLATDPAVDRAPSNVTLTDRSAVLAQSDILSLHVPLTSATRHLIDRTAIAAMRPGALLVNTARGGVVDDVAVCAALDSGHLGGYAVDVFDPEPPEAAHPLLHHPKVLATPHMAAMTEDALADMARSVAEGVVAVLAGHSPANLVTKEDR